MRRRVNQGVRTVLHSMKAPLKVHHLPRITAAGTCKVEDREEKEFENSPLIGPQSNEAKITVLEQEVDFLKRKLCIEENVHRVLEGALDGNESPTALPPPDIPPQISDLVAEVASLEEEVVQLGSILLQLRQDMYQEAILTSAITKKVGCSAAGRATDVGDDKGLNTEKTRDNKSETLGSTSNLNSLARLMDLSNTPETISNQHSLAQLMDFSETPESTSNQHSLAQLMDFSQSSEKCYWDQELEQENTLQNDPQSDSIHDTSDLRQPLIPTSSKMVGSPLARSQLHKNLWNRRSSTMSDATHSTKRTHKAAGNKPLSKHISLISNDTIDETGSGPNEISENILKCLLNIFSTRATSSKTRINANLNQLMTPNTGPDVGDDPYGVSVDCRRSSIGPYGHFLSVDNHSFDLDRDPSPTSLSHKLKILLRKLAFADLRDLTHQMKVAFWINIYNSCMMNAFLEHGAPDSPEMVMEMMQKAHINVSGNLLNAMSIEHSILRSQSHSRYALSKTRGKKDTLRRNLCTLEKNEPLVTFALSCGSWSSPAVRVYTASQIENELEIAKRDYLQASLGISPKKKLFVPKLLEWYQFDFTKDDTQLIDWICMYIPNNLRSEIVKIGQHESDSSKWITVMPYEFNFRYLIAR